jgi:hypothetical protein
MKAASIRACHAGPMPLPDVDIEDVPDLADASDDDDEDDRPYVGEDLLEEGDHIFVATIPCKAEFV